jgi:hypothetical protein
MDAAKRAGFSVQSESHVYRNVEPARKRGILHSLKRDAKKAIAAFVRGEAVGAAVPKASDVMAAAREILDREEPKVQRVDTRSVSVSLAPEQRARLQGLVIPSRSVTPQDD